MSAVSGFSKQQSAIFSFALHINHSKEDINLTRLYKIALVASVNIFHFTVDSLYSPIHLHIHIKNKTSATYIINSCIINELAGPSLIFVILKQAL